MSTPRRLGYIPDDRDERDLHIARLGLPASIPAAFSLRDHVLEVLNQGDTSSCVAHAWAQALRIADKVAGAPSPQLTSREFLYFNARKFDGGAMIDNGTQLRSCGQGVMKYGRPPESAWPFNEGAINTQPPWDAYRQGYDYKGPAGYYRVTTIAELKQALAASKPVVGGADVGNSIFDYISGIYDPDPNEASIGGHALCFTGYTSDHLELVNSWGLEYGESGFMRVSERFAATFTDLWAVHL